MQRSFVRFGQSLNRIGNNASRSLISNSSTSSFLNQTKSSATSTPTVSFSSASSLTTIKPSIKNMKLNLRYLSEAGLSLYSCMSDDDGG